MCAACIHKRLLMGSQILDSHNCVINSTNWIVIFQYFQIASPQNRFIPSFSPLSVGPQSFLTNWITSQKYAASESSHVLLSCYQSPLRSLRLWHIFIFQLCLRPDVASFRSFLQDLRNYQYSLSMVGGLRIHMEMGHSYIDIPKGSFNEVARYYKVLNIS